MSVAGGGGGTEGARACDGKHRAQSMKEAVCSWFLLQLVLLARVSSLPTPFWVPVQYTMVGGGDGFASSRARGGWLK